MNIKRERDAFVSFVTHFTKKVLKENDALKESASQAMYLIVEGIEDMPIFLASDMHKLFHFMVDDYKSSDQSEEYLL